MKRKARLRRTAKSGTLGWWKKKLWEHFTAYIKERDNWTCVTCGKKAKGYGMGGGHYIAKGGCGNEYYFHERNVHAQCTNCNLKLEGNRPAYREFILRTYGEETLHDLENNYHKPTPWKADKYAELIEVYKRKLKELDE